MSYRKVEEWDVDEVCTWLDAIGLGDKTGPFRDEAVDGALLVDLEETDLTEDLRLTQREYQKFLKCLDFARKIVQAKLELDESEDLGERANALELKVSDLECRLEEKDGRIKELEAATTAAAAAVASEPTSVYVPPPASAAASSSSPPPQASAAPPPTQESAKPPPPPPTKKKEEEEKPKKVKGRPVAREAAKGTAAGAVGGAVFGAVAPGTTAGEGAKAGAATGAAVGGLRGIRERRKQQGKKVLFGGSGKGWLS